MSEQVYLTPEELSQRFQGKVSVGTLRQWRHKKKGPPYTRVGQKPLYPLDKVIEWEQKNTVGEQPKES